MAHFMPELPSNIAAPLCSILLIFILDWRMGLASLITIPLGILFFAAMMRGYGPRMENYMRSANDMNSSLGFTSHIFSTGFVIRPTGQQEDDAHHYHTKNFGIFRGDFTKVQF